MHRGSCLCGRVSFEVAAPLPPPDACHCRTCRKHSGHYFASTDVPKAADVALGRRHGEAGLPAPSVVRTSKIATVEAERMSPLGRLPEAFLAAVEAQLDVILARKPDASPA